MIPQAFNVATSRYQEHELIRKSGLTPVRITLGKPRMRLPYSIASEIRMLAPTPSEFRITDDEQFASAYRSRLDHIGADAVVNALTATNNTKGGNGLVLLCFENLTLDPTCHRRLLAEWMRVHLGWDVPELPAVATDSS